jgi:hypothetical protein
MTKHLLTTIVLLLSFSTYAAAQGNIDGFKDWGSSRTLEGLREIGVVVKYGQVDGLEASMQPAILKMLKDRANELLKQGTVPLLESTDEASMIDKPRLVVTVTVKKQTDIGPRLQIETKLFQRVSLWRDPSQVIELPTWDWTAPSQQVDYETLSNFFDTQVNLFVKTYKEANPNAPRVENPLPQLKSSANALQGLSGIDFIVSIGFFESVDERLHQLSGPLRDETEKKFKRAGIPLLRRPDAASAGYPLLNVRIMLNPKGVSYAHATEIRTEFMQRVCPLQDPKKYSYISTWDVLTFDDTAITEDIVRKILNTHLDQFIEAYKTANPNPKP